VIRHKKIRIHQFHSGSAVGDAIINSMLFVQSMLRSFGFESNIYVEHLAPGLTEKILQLDDLRVAEDDLLLVHHSMGHDAFPRLAALRCRKFLVYHNITPPELLEDPGTQAYAIKGYSLLSQFRDIVEAAIAVSSFNARQLIRRGFDDVAVIPLLKDFMEIRNSRHSKIPYYDELPIIRILFVGRVVPHKCQHELINFVEKVRSIGRVPVGLVLAGACDSRSPYQSRLNEFIRRAGLGQNVKITGQVGDEELFGWYRAANAYVSLSEHEGFGVPLIEAMAFDLPVIAYASSAVPETLGEAGISISDKDPATLLEALIRVHQDRAYREEVIRSQRSRLLRFSRQRIETELRDWLIRVGAYDGVAEPSGLDARIDEGSAPARRTHYVIEGPYETSYSLAIVNRNIALALSRREECTAYIEPADGTEDYAVDPIAAGRLPAEIQSLVQPATVTPERIVTIRNTYPPRPNGMLGDLRLMHLAWEESSIPDSVTGLINLHVDGVLVPSEYTKRVVRNSGVRVPIAVIGHGVDHGRVLPRASSRTKRGPVTRALPFTFLHISSGLERKGIEELVTAYCLAFSRNDPVLLVIKTFANPTNTVDSWTARLTSSSRYSPAIQVISEELDQREMDFLYDVSDAVVLPTRGEGFNLPAAEGMARGLPVIVTRHSGHLDFCNEENSYLIDCTYEFSNSHLQIPNSYWARPSTEQLFRIMKEVYRAGRSQESITAARAAQGQRDALQLRWYDVAKQVEGFVGYLDKRPVMRRKLRLGWISTYNARCGIAAHSEHLLEFLDKSAFDITIIADDQEQIGPDPDNVLRLWSKVGGRLARVRDFLITNRFDAAFFQHNLRFYDFEEFVETLLALAEAGIDTFVTFHRTTDLQNHDRVVSQQRMTQAFQTCARIFVHSLDDVNRLREWGVTQNVVLLTHGVIDRTALNPDGVRGLLGLSGFSPVVGTFGFMLPGKGLTELIHGFALMLKAYPTAYLLMVNADYPLPESQEERERCRALVRLLEIEDRVRMTAEFLDVEETLFLLSACDVIVYPYQRSEESASGAVRLGLAAGRPVVTTPLPTFSDISEIVYQLSGTGPSEIAEGIISLLQDDEGRADLLQRQWDWVRANSWATQAARISNIVLGCFEETRGVELRTTLEADSGSSLPPDATVRRLARSSSSPDEDLPKVLDLKAAGGPDSASAATGSAEIVDPPLPPIVPARGFGFFRGGGAKLPRVDRGPDAKKLLSRADRARDSRDWGSAARYYREALDLQPDNPPAWVQYGHALKESGNLREAENAYRQSLELDADVADTHLQLGHALKIQGRKIDASIAYLRALALDPALDHALFELKGLGWTSGRIQLTLRRGRGELK
jgi:glycosyltransferase involved in cell wall biosynthesis